MKRIIVIAGIAAAIVAAAFAESDKKYLNSLWYRAEEAEFQSLTRTAQEKQDRAAAEAKWETQGLTWLAEPMKVGTVGSSWHGRIHVIQIMSPSEVVATVYAAIPYESRNWKDSYPARVYKVVIKGVDTTGFVDGSNVRNGNQFAVVGTETRKLANGGTETRFVLQPSPARALH